MLLTSVQSQCREVRWQVLKARTNEHATRFQEGQGGNLRVADGEHVWCVHEWLLEVQACAILEKDSGSAWWRANPQILFKDLIYSFWTGSNAERPTHQWAHQ